MSEQVNQYLSEHDFELDEIRIQFVTSMSITTGILGSVDYLYEAYLTHPADESGNDAAIE